MRKVVDGKIARLQHVYIYATLYKAERTLLARFGAVWAVLDSAVAVAVQSQPTLMSR